MVNQEIIRTLNLKKTDFFIRDSVQLNCYIYIYPNGFKGYKTYVMDCDPEGKPLLNEIMFMLLPVTSGMTPIISVIPNSLAADNESLLHFIVMIQDVIKGEYGTY